MPNIQLSTKLNSTKWIHLEPYSKWSNSNNRSILWQLFKLFYLLSDKNEKGDPHF